MSDHHGKAGTRSTLKTLMDTVTSLVKTRTRSSRSPNHHCVSGFSPKQYLRSPVTSAWSVFLLYQTW